VAASYIGLREWDLALTNLNAALKIDKDYPNALYALYWAKEGKAAAKKGKTVGIPTWN
jgi:hypothetical protein